VRSTSWRGRVQYRVAQADGAILFEKLKLPPVKKTKTGYSTDADVLEQLALGHALPAKIHRAPDPRQAQVHLRDACPS